MASRTLEMSLKNIHDKGKNLDSDPEYEYILNEPEKCRIKDPFLVVLITSVPRELEKRQVIRETWANETLLPGIVIKILFLLGSIPALTKADPLDLQQQLKEESHQHRDLLQQNFVDAYDNLTLKTMMGLHWVYAHCPHAAYVMKTDSDMFVNLEVLVKVVLKPELPPRPDYFTGHVKWSISPNRNKKSKWYISPEEFPGKKYAPYCAGAGYVFSGWLASQMYRTSRVVPRINFEDVYVGLCLEKLNVKPVVPPRGVSFSTLKVPFSVCKYKQIVTSHRVSPPELRLYWDQLQQNKNSTCGTAKRRRRDAFL
ncbi:beta-1,3-galactosyltransferase 2-like [Petromyzon marinus]|uniref:beta-1,3-galactosyltransferase 2-like n=1 Tax=Petromyzon marinus TaxID=7757 RepID=UPI003F727DF7